MDQKGQKRIHRRYRRLSGRIWPVIAVLSFFLAALGCFLLERREQDERVYSYGRDGSYFSDLTWTCKQGSMQNVRFSSAAGDGDGVYTAYLPAEFSHSPILHYSLPVDVRIDGREVPSDSHVALEEGETYRLDVIFKGKTLESGTFTVQFADTLPTMYIATSTGNMRTVNSDKTYKEDADYEILEADGTENALGKCWINLRGNWTREPVKKPYALHLKGVKSLLGMEAEKDWNLLANWYDVSGLNNMMALTTGREIGLSYTPDSRFVNLYLNGQYAGVYQLTQKVDVKDGTVHIRNLEKENPDEEGSRSSGDISGGYLLELGKLYGDEVSYFTSRLQDIHIRSPKYATDDEMSYIENYIAQAEDALTAGPSDTGTGTASPDNSDTGGETEGSTSSGSSAQEGTEDPLTQYFDLDSWCAMYFAQDFFLNKDEEYGSYYCYKNPDDSHLYAGPLWDMDLLIDLYSPTPTEIQKPSYPAFTASVLWPQSGDRVGRGAVWTRSLMQHEVFREKFDEMAQKKFIPAVKEMMRNQLPEWYREIKKSLAMDSDLYGRHVYTEEDLVSFQNWLQERIDFYEVYYGHESDYVTVTFSYGRELPEDQQVRDNRYDIVMAVKKGETLSAIPGDADDWMKEDGSAFDVTAPVTADEILVKKGASSSGS